MSSPPSARRPNEGGAADGAHDRATGFEVGLLVDQLPAILYVADVGIEAKWHYVSRGIVTILGFSQEEWMDDPSLWARQMHPEDRDRVFGREAELVAPTVPDEYRIRHRDGSTVWVRDEAALVTDERGHGLWHGVILDITDRKLAEAELERRSEQQAAVARLGERALEGADIVDLMHDALEDASRILELEAGAVFEQAPDSGALTMRARIGLSQPKAPDRLAHTASLDGPHTEDRVRGRPAGGPHSQLLEGVSGNIAGKDGLWGVLWLADPGTRSLGTADADFAQALANILADAIQRRATEDDIRYQATHDPLTGLPNRALLLDRLGNALARPGGEVAVVLLDIDHFKRVNDSLGHSAGDELLMQVAPRLATALRPEDTIARLGGDEFVVLLEQGRDERSARIVAERIIASFESPFILNAGEHFAKASLGIAIAKRRGSTPASLIRDADVALYRAKEMGRDRFEIFDRAMRARTLARLTVENELRRALERDELRVAYQPIVSLRDRSIVSVEALLRWEHRDRGLIGPAEFIPVAEENGMIEPIGRWVLESACNQAAVWHAARPDSPPLGISVNLSVRQFMQRDLEAMVAETLTSSGIEPSSLCLEITESVMLKEPERVSDKIRRVARLGVRFALDDFGTGYSSLVYLSGLPIDGLKIDQAFVHEIGGSVRSTAITTAIVRMAQALNIDVIAEGVETEHQALALRALACEFAQGFYFHRPVTAEAVSQLVCADGPRARPTLNTSS